MGNKRSGQRHKRKATAAAPRREQALATRREQSQGDLSARAEQQTSSPAVHVEPVSAPAEAQFPLGADALKASIAALTASALTEPEPDDEIAFADSEGAQAFEDETYAEAVAEPAETPLAESTESGEPEPTPTTPTRIIASTARKYPTLASMAAVVPPPARTDAADRAEPPALDTAPTPSQPSSPRWRRPTESLAAQKWAALEQHEASIMRELTAKDDLERLDPIGADDDSQAQRSRGRPLDGGNPVLAVAACQAALVAVAALVGAFLLIDHQSLAIWAWLFAGIAGLGGWLAYALGQDEQGQPYAGGVLLASQFGMFGWAFALLGPRASLLAIVPPLMLLALRTAGRAAATVWVIATLVIYAVFLVFSAEVNLQPVLRLDPGVSALLNGAFVTVGLVLTLVGMLRMGERLLRAEALTRMRVNEARLLRARVVSLQRRASEDAERLYELSDAAMRGHLRDITPLDPTLRPVVERLRATATRVAEQREQRLEHQRLEAALRQLTRALERGWLGLRWTWPKPSGTAVDELMALLRAPSPRDGGALRADDPSSSHGLTPLPTDPEMIARDRTQMLPGRARSTPTTPTMPGTPSEYAQARTQPLPVPPKANAPLHWEEWDEWRDWQNKQD